MKELKENETVVIVVALACLAITTIANLYYENKCYHDYKKHDVSVTKESYETYGRVSILNICEKCGKHKITKLFGEEAK